MLVGLCLLVVKLTFELHKGSSIFAENNDVFKLIFVVLQTKY